MNGNGLVLALNRIFCFIFVFLFGCTLIGILIFGYENESNSDTYLCTSAQHIKIILSMLLLTALFTAVYIIIFNRIKSVSRLNRERLSPDKITLIIIFSVVGAMLIVQLVCGSFLMMKPVTDLKIINKYALNFSKTGNYNLIQRDYNKGSVYMMRYPNNLAILFILSSIYRINYMISGSVNMYVPIVINTFAINISVLMTALLARKVFGNRKALFTLLLCTLFMPYYTYTPYYYTDTLSMPFLIGGVYLFVSADKTHIRYKKYIFTIISGALIFLGYKVKGSLIILILTAVVYIILKYSFKRSVCFILSLIAGFGGVGLIYSTALKNSGIVSEKQSYECEYPYTHWVMMGLEGLGNYHSKDSQYTASFCNKDEKIKGDMKLIQNRLNNYGVTGIVVHTAKKAVWTWEDGTYYISHHIEDCKNKNIFHSYVLNDGENHFPFYAYSCGYQLFLILMMIMSALKGFIKPQINTTTLFRGLVFGVYLFFIIWETRSRYLYNFTPIFTLLAVDGLDFVKNIFDSLKSRSTKQLKSIN